MVISKQYKLSMSKDKVLASNLRIGDRYLYKGTVISSKEITDLQNANIKHVYAAELTKDCFTLENSQNIISNKICGKNLTYAISYDGKVDLLATENGFLMTDISRIEKFCSYSKNIKINVIPTYQQVKKGDVVAIIDFSSTVYLRKDIDSLIFALDGNDPLISVVQKTNKKVAIINVVYYDDDIEKKYFKKNNEYLKNIFSSLGVEFVGSYEVYHDYNEIADTIQKLKLLGVENIYISSALDVRGEGSEIYQALIEVCESVDRKIFSKIGFLDIIFATSKRLKILLLPSLDISLFSDYTREIIIKLILKEKIRIEDVVENNVLVENGLIDNDLFKEYKSLSVAKEDIKEKKDIAVVILAAGPSKRTLENKLLFDVDGEAMVLRAVNSAIESKVGPVYIVTGYDADKINEILANLDVNIIHNDNYQGGVKSSIKLGIEFIPGYCNGVILLPADMPNITAKHLDNMARAFDRRKNKSLIVSSYKDKVSNPLLWSRGFFGYVDLWPENTENRQVFLEFQDFINRIEVEKQEELLDVNYLYDLEALDREKTQETFSKRFKLTHQ